MPWCPKCGTEYREGFAECVDCHVPLLDKKPISPPEADLQEHEYLLDPVVAYQVATTAEARMVCETLRNADIACITRESSLGGILATYTGSSIYGTDIVVDRTRLEDAREVLQIWAAQDERAPVSEEDLAQLALSELPEAELAAQAEAEEPAMLSGNRSYKFMKIMLGVIAALAVIILILTKFVS